MARTSQLAVEEPSDWLSRLDPLSRGGIRERLLALAALLALSALPLLFLAPLFGAPFERDQGIYATIARGWLEGSIPYRDLWDNKGPLLFLWYAASFKWLGESIVAPRLLAGLAAGLSVPFVWGTARALFGTREAALAAGLFALSFANLYLQVTANAEVFMLLPLTAGLCAFAMGARSGRPLWFLAAGAATALAVFTRQSAVWAFIAYGAWLAVLFYREEGERPRLARSAAWLGLGGAVGSAPFVAYFAVHGALYQLWHAMFAFNWAWAGEFPLYLKIIPPIVANPVPLLGGLVFWTLAALGVWRLWRRGDRYGWLIISFLAFSEAAAQTLGKTSPHYSIHLLPGAAVAAALGLLYVGERWRQGRRRLGMLTAGATGVTIVAAAFAYAQPSAEDRFEVQYGMTESYAERAVDAQAIADAVERLTGPGDYVYEWGRDSEILFLADRRPASRWVHNRPYSVDESMITEVMDDLEEKRPSLILLTANQGPAGAGGSGLPGPLEAYLRAHYSYVGQVEYAELYQRESR